MVSLSSGRDSAAAGGSESENPAIDSPTPKTGGRPHSLKDWWPDSLDLSVLHAHSSHAKVHGTFGRRPQTDLDTGLRLMADWVRTHGARSTPPFRGIEIPRNLPPSWS